MSAGVGRWRAMYTPGDWVLLSGPTSTVLLEPPPPERSSMIEVLWEEVLASSSMTDLAGRLASYPLDSLPSFAAFFWTADGMRSLVRGSVAVIDLSSGVTVADGEGIQTWSEVGLGHVAQVLVEVQVGTGTRQELPLVVGAVRASSLRLDASEAARVHSPQVPAEAAAPPYAEQAPAYAEDGAAYAAEPEGAEDHGRPDQDQPAQDQAGLDAGWAAVAAGGAAVPAGLPPVPGPPAELPGASTELLAEPFTPDESPLEWRSEDWPADAWSPGPSPEPAAPEPEAEEPDAEADGGAGADEEAEADQGPGADHGGEVDDGADGYYPDPADPNIEYPMWAPDPEPSPARALPPDGTEEMENADTQLMAPPSSDPTTGPDGPTTGTDGVSQNSLIMAVVCQYGHASAQNATTCRICGSPINPQGPQLLPRPVLAVLRSSDGTTAEVDRAVLVGRAPSAQRSSARAPKLMTVPSPGHDISRTHLEVAPDAWSVVVTDLHSTNGTILVRPGGVDRQPLPAGESVPVELGSVVELGDGISVLIDFPQ